MYILNYKGGNFGAQSAKNGGILVKIQESFLLNGGQYGLSAASKGRYEASEWGIHDLVNNQYYRRFCFPPLKLSGYEGCIRQSETARLPC